MSHYALQLLFESLGHKDLMLETFVDGQEILKRVTSILNDIDPSTIADRDI